MPLLAAGVAGLTVLAVMLGVLGTFSAGAGMGTQAACLTKPGRTSTEQIPPAYLALYRQAGAAYKIPWHVLAAVGAIESDHGRGPGPGIRQGRNSAGAAGPMQFMPGTWAAFAVDGNHDGRKNVYDPADAIPAAARYLRHNGAPTRLPQALFQYNHADWYVKKVQAKAADYARDIDTSACTAMAGASMPASGRAAVAVRAALRWIGAPYSWGGGSLTGPSKGFGRGAGIVGFDCSGLTRYAWHQAGITLPRVAADQMRATHPIPAGQQHPGDLAFFSGAGGSRGNPGHVGLVLGRGRMIEAPRTGLPVRISSIAARSDLIGYRRPTQGSTP